MIKTNHRDKNEGESILLYISKIYSILLWHLDHKFCHIKIHLVVDLPR